MDELLEYVQEGNILDLGCGDGTNVAYLRKKGFDVTAIDKKSGKDIMTVDMRLFQFKKYDVIMCIVALHFIKDAKKMIEKMKQHARINLVLVLREGDPTQAEIGRAHV